MCANQTMGPITYHCKLISRGRIKISVARNVNWIPNIAPLNIIFWCKYIQAQIQTWTQMCMCACTCMCTYTHTHECEHLCTMNVLSATFPNNIFHFWKKFRILCFGFCYSEYVFSFNEKQSVVLFSLGWLDTLRLLLVL